MTDETAIVVRDETVRLGAMTLAGPQEVIGRATAIAKELTKIVKDKKLSVTIQGREFVRVEAWTTMGAMLGVLPREIEGSIHRLEDGSYEAAVELIRVSDGAIIGRASSLVGMDEKDRGGKATWANRPEYARRSMAVTRATGKAFRLGFSWIITLAGYEPTPAEEMDGIVDAEYRQAPAAPPPTHHAAQPAPVMATPELSLETAMQVKNSDGKMYGELDTATLSGMANTIARKIKAGGYKPDELDEMQYKLSAIRTLLAAPERPEPGA